MTYSQTVQMGKQSKATLRYIFSNPNTQAEGFSIKTYEQGNAPKYDFKKAENPFMKAEVEYDEAVSQSDTLLNGKKSAERTRDDAKTARDSANTELTIKQNIRDDLADRKRVLGNSAPPALLQELQTAENNFQQAQTQLAKKNDDFTRAQEKATEAQGLFTTNEAKIAHFKTYRDTQVQQVLGNLEKLLKDGQAHVTFIRPSSAERYQREHMELQKLLPQERQPELLRPPILPTVNQPTPEPLLPQPTLDLWGVQNNQVDPGAVQVPLLPSR